jgi:zinc and cadmium transporter
MTVLHQAVPYILCLSAASFIYIAVADLVPSLHRHNGRMASLCQLALLLSGIGIIAWLSASHGHVVPH